MYMDQQPNACRVLNLSLFVFCACLVFFNLCFLSSSLCSVSGIPSTMMCTVLSILLSVP